MSILNLKLPVTIGVVVGAIVSCASVAHADRLKADAKILVHPELFLLDDDPFANDTSGCTKDPFYFIGPIYKCPDNPKSNPIAEGQTHSDILRPEVEAAALSGNAPAVAQDDSTMLSDTYDDTTDFSNAAPAPAGSLFNR